MEKACDVIANRILLPKLILEDFVKKTTPQTRIASGNSPANRLSALKW
jgi:hypothetical protein